MRPNLQFFLRVPLLSMVLAGCSNDDAELLGETFDTSSLSMSVQPIFDANCAFSGCHGGSAPQANMSLEAPNIFKTGIGIVGVPSLETTLLLRVMPGDSNASYLIHKLEGTQLRPSVGGCCDQMPQGVQPLNSATIQVIRDWIDQGSQNN